MPRFLPGHWHHKAGGSRACSRLGASNAPDDPKTPQVLSSLESPLLLGGASKTFRPKIETAPTVSVEWNSSPSQSMPTTMVNAADVSVRV